VRDGDRVVYERNATKPLVPASSLKLVTAAAALDVLGPDHRFHTSVRVASAPTAGVINGDVWFVGGGDPILATAAYVARYDEPQAFTDLAGLVTALRAAGVTEIRGDIVGDDTRYDNQRSVPSWDPVFVRDNESGPLSALSVNDGFATYPPKNRSNSLAKAAADPAQNSAAVLATLLADAGIRVTGTARSGAAPAGAVEVAGIDSRPLREIVTQMLTTSDNTSAELLTKELGVQAGRGGTTKAGLAVARDALARAGLLADGVVLNDGSGLDRGDRLTCGVLAGLLQKAGPDSPLAAGLAVAGRSGTLRERLAGTVAAGHVRAKTGSVRNSRALAGFADTGGVHPLTFAYVANEERLDAGANLAVQDRMGLDLVGYPDGPSATQLGPLPVLAAFDSANQQPDAVAAPK
jgi:D-alanyl-D-alanine carboxypeptidase/D-alanyl-D-alanine-endopeptidase (penicillin-binding protein 4)